MTPGDGDSRHGTVNGYSNLKCRCADCREAWRIKHAEYMARRRANGWKPKKNGKSRVKPTPKSGFALKARAAAHISWANTDDRTGRTSNGRAKFMDRFEEPYKHLPPDERALRAEHARKAYFAMLAVKSAEARAAANRSSSGE